MSICARWLGRFRAASMHSAPSKAFLSSRRTPALVADPGARGYKNKLGNNPMRRPKDPLPGLWRREGLTPDLPLGFSLGGGWVARPVADPSQATGRVKRGATTSFTAPAYWKFESTPLQQTVRLSPDFA